MSTKSCAPPDDRKLAMPKVNKVGSSRLLTQSSKLSNPASKSGSANGADAMSLDGERQQVSQQSSTAPPAPPAAADDDSSEKVGEKSRGQKKREAKRLEFLKKLSAINSSLNLDPATKEAPTRKKAPAPKPAVNTMGDLMDALNEDAATAAAHDQSAPKVLSHVQVKSNRAKQAVALKELEHFKLVLQHPVFAKDPFAAMQQHLHNTLAPAANNSGAGWGGAAGGGAAAKQPEPEFKRNGSSHRKKR